MTLFKRSRLLSLLAAALVMAAGISTPAHAFKISAAVGDAMLTTLKDQPAGGTLVIYSGTQPADPDTALSGNTVLASFTLNSPACGSNSTSGSFKVCTLSFASSTVTISASGTATFARMFESDGTTADADWTVATSGADINFNSTAFSSGATATLGTVLLKEPIH